MANTYTSLHYHIIFSTKRRVRWLVSEIEQRVWEYLGGIARKHKMTALQIGGTADHIHALVLAPPVLSPSQIAQFLKGDSSKWLHDEFRGMRNFAWQDGYAAYTVTGQICLRLSNTFRTSASTTESRPSRKSTWSFSNKMESSTMSVICGADSSVATRRAA